MKRYVRYLCPSVGKPGFVFPDEVEENQYIPGLFVIEENDNHEFDAFYDFTAVQSGKPLQLSLERLDKTSVDAAFQSSLFQVKTPQLGTFLFRAIKKNAVGNRDWRYVGTRKRMKNHNPLWILESIDDSRLEAVCRKADFFFAGSIE